MNGRDKHNASNIKLAAAPIVSLDSNVWVPRGPKAVLDTELENKAPAATPTPTPTPQATPAAATPAATQPGANTSPSPAKK